MDYERHQVFRIVGESGFAELETVSERWRPWYEDLPVIEGRVLTAAGIEHTLAADTIAEHPVEAGDGTFTDARDVIAPLPAISAGAIVEVRVRIRERTAPFRSGRLSGFAVTTQYPTVRREVSIALPDDMPFRWVVRGGATEPPEESPQLLTYPPGYVSLSTPWTA